MLYVRYLMEISNILEEKLTDILSALELKVQVFCLDYVYSVYKYSPGGTEHYQAQELSVLSCPYSLVKLC